MSCTSIRQRRRQPWNKPHGNDMNPLTPDKVKLGFIGLGNMGSRIARRLLNEGYHLTAYDRAQVKAEEMAAHGAILASSVAEVARAADVILSYQTNAEADLTVHYVEFCRFTLSTT